MYYSVNQTFKTIALAYVPFMFFLDEGPYIDPKRINMNLKITTKISYVPFIFS